VFNAFILSQCTDLRIGVMWQNLGALTAPSKRVLNFLMTISSLFTGWFKIELTIWIILFAGITGRRNKITISPTKYRFISITIQLIRNDAKWHYGHRKEIYVKNFSLLSRSKTVVKQELYFSVSVELWTRVLCQNSLWNSVKSEKQCSRLRNIYTNLNS